ncbi:MAG: hypothetical protein IT361_01105 [Gemmatimonadaceae bacterium]|nr:hypothetical protein [Gemmatimonadaceae bacterium]
MSVIVTVVDGGDAVVEVLDALVRQAGAPPLEILVAWDDTIPEVGALSTRFPAVRFIGMGPVATARPPKSPAGQHELFDRRRSAALTHASGELVAMVEDRARPRPDWAATMVRAHRDLPHGVIGGAIAPATTDVLNWSVWAVDYGRYAPPFATGARDWVSDVNVCYKRRCIEATRTTWHDRYNEARVHWSLAASGEVLFLIPDAVVEFRSHYATLGTLARQRFHWGRLFGQVRAGDASVARRAALVLASPIVPFVLLLRHGRTQQRLGNAPSYLRALPTVLAILVAWSAGEAWGAITGRA